MKCEQIYRPEEIRDVIAEIKDGLSFVRCGKKSSVYNIPCAFDIETTSTFINGEKLALMYEWTFGINGLVIIGRTWREFVNMLVIISRDLQLTENRRLLVYVHNLAFEFQFMRKWLEWEKVFAISQRTPIYALTTLGIEFRCSYLLSGYSLAKLGDELRTYKIKKLYGDLDYTLPRHSETPLNDEEIAYCVNDVKIVMAYIAERMEQDGHLGKIPLTKTGYVRKFCRTSCLGSNGEKYKRFHYMELMNGLTLTPGEYKQLKRAFQGGFTHANPFYSGRVVENVTSYDFTSSYPAVMLSEKFPMSKAEVVEITSVNELEKNLQLYCCLFDIEIIGLQAVVWYENYISQSRCWNVEKPIVNNGRLVHADRVCLSVTEIDFNIIRKFYRWEKIRISNFRRYKKDYLPTDFVKSILKLYSDKTTLKGVSGKEIEYLKSKEMLNSCYGMCVTDIVRDEIEYTNDWTARTPDIKEEISKYNKDPSRFLFYPWGVWVTAYARRNLFTGIREFNHDYIYSDTDSIKVINAEDHKTYIEKYNQSITSRLKIAMTYHGIDTALTSPKTIKGELKPLGVWDFDGEYKRFKTLGAKRYMVEYPNGEINITVSGLNKRRTVPYLTEKYKDNVFEAFNTDLYIPADYTGKMTHTYIDDEREGVLIDYRGTPGRYRELSGVHLSNADYSLSIAREYADYLTTLFETEVVQ